MKKSIFSFYIESRKGTKFIFWLFFESNGRPIILYVLYRGGNVIQNVTYIYARTRNKIHTKSAPLRNITFGNQGHIDGKMYTMNA